MRRMVNHAKRVDQVVLGRRDELAEPLGVRLDEGDAILEPEYLGPPSRQIERGVGQIDSSDVSPCTREVHRVGAETAANFQHPLAAPALELRKAWNMRFDE